MNKIEIITRPEKLNDLKEAMYAIRVTGMTVMQVYGCGLSHGYTEIYRGQEMSINLLPKIKVEIVVSEIPVEKVIEAAEKACRTGHIGDGKIFVTTVDNAIRIRTGESGVDAIRDRNDETDIVNSIIKE
ncbi:MAG: P-II family nitrogen regulator [Megasphaera sp.]|nr:P-II family nitrogen regulator [Megasphaera sp.]